MSLEHVKLLIADVDGVLTDGMLYVSTDGSETKRFNVRDWTGIKYLRRAGVEVALVSGNSSDAVTQRAEYIGITEVHQGAKFKLPVVKEMIARLKLRREEVAYIGDDLLDIPPCRAVGFSVAVADAHPELIGRVDHVTKARGGEGAVREIAEEILKALGKWDLIMRRYLEDDAAGESPEGP
ncbi:MAG TPA: HAD-IIIA family hydrolase [Planctomycetota bacterium]|nr:HAD-IIIA family hydrolase [Planctomycetota bacterium]